MIQLSVAFDFTSIVKEEPCGEYSLHINASYFLSLDGKVIAHCSSNTHDFLYPSIPPYYGSGREILLYKTSKFKPIRVTVSNA